MVDQEQLTDADITCHLMKVLIWSHDAALGVYNSFYLTWVTYNIFVFQYYMVLL